MKIFNYRAICILISLSSLGCSVGPAYQAPRILSPSPAGSQDVRDYLAETTASWAAQIAPDLEQALSRVAANNNTIKIATANLDEANARFRAARGALLPTIAINGAGNSTDIAGVSGERYQGGAQLGWEIDVWGRIRKGLDAAKADAIAVRETLRGVRLSAMTEFVEGYFLLIGLKESLDISQQALALRERALELQQARYDAGAISLLDLKQAQAARDSVAARIPETRARIADAEAGLLTLIGSTEKTTLPTRRKISEVVFKLPEIRSSINALRERPDVAVAEARAFGAEDRAAEAFRGLLPRISFDGVLNYDSDEFGSWIEKATRFWSLGGSAAWTAFKGGALWENYRAAEAREQAAMFSYAGTVIAAANEIQAARQRLAAGRSESQLRAEELRSLGDALQTAKLLYSEGRVAYLNVLDTERDALNSELLLVSSYVEQARRYVGLQRAIGVPPIADGRRGAFLID